MVRNCMGVCAAIAAVSMATPAAAAGKLDPSYTYKVAGVRSDVRGLATGRVVEVDKVQRAVTVQDADGMSRRFKAHSRVSNLEQIQVEDDVVVEFWRSARVYATAPGAKARPPEIVKALEADASGTSAGEALQIAGSGTATVEAIDPATGVVTFRGPDGLAYPSKIEDPLLLQGFAVGQKFDFDVYEATAMAVQVKAKPLPPPPPPPPPPVVTERARIVEKKIEITESVLFATNKADIDPKSYALLDDVATIMQGNPQVKKVRVEGNASKDPLSAKRKGGAEYNLKLSSARAAAVKDYLVKKGVDPARLDSIGFGWERPVDTNATAAGRAKNRRVDFMILDQ